MVQRPGQAPAVWEAWPKADFTLRFSEERPILNTDFQLRYQVPSKTKVKFNSSSASRSEHLESLLFVICVYLFHP